MTPFEDDWLPKPVFPRAAISATRSRLNMKVDSPLQAFSGVIRFWAPEGRSPRVTRDPGGARPDRTGRPGGRSVLVRRGFRASYAMGAPRVGPVITGQVPVRRRSAYHRGTDGRGPSAGEGMCHGAARTGCGRASITSELPPEVHLWQGVTTRRIRAIRSQVGTYQRKGSTNRSHVVGSNRA